MSAMIVLGQWRVQRRQGQLQEAEAHRQQAAAWTTLAESWEMALLPAVGMTAVQRFGVGEAKATRFIEAVERYRVSRIRELPFFTGSAEPSDDWEKVIREQTIASDGLIPYQAAVRRVMTHLAQTSSLVLRKRLSLDAVYEAFGLEVIRVGDDLLELLRSRYGHGSSCPAPDAMEWESWKDLSAAEVVRRIGWGEFLDVARGTSERIALFLDLLVVHAIEVGDLDARFQNPGGLAPGEILGERSRLAVAWRAASRYGLMRAFRLTWRLASTSRRATRVTHWRTIDWINRLQERIQWKRWPPERMFLLKVNGSLRWPLDILIAPIQVVGAAWRSRKVADIRLMDVPAITQTDLTGEDDAEMAMMS
ncbi:hypothetical protein [Micromonospora sp. bgisy143]|uniref:hypothetical protein n=1 Tax=Micromonospora sp. bgisy143 TaxID=3413790 RepID=UPI003EB7710B